MPLLQDAGGPVRVGRAAEGYEGDSFAFSDEVMEKTDVFLTPGGIFSSEGNGYIRASRSAAPRRC